MSPKVSKAMDPRIVTIHEMVARMENAVVCLFISQDILRSPWLLLMLSQNYLSYKDELARTHRQTGREKDKDGSC